MDVFEHHEAILRQAVGRFGWRTMPAGGSEAIEAGLVIESDPTWVYSDAYGACNGFSLTDEGRTLMKDRGFLCQCGACGLRSIYGPRLTLETYCSVCNASIQQYGLYDEGGETGCKMCFTAKAKQIQ